MLNRLANVIYWLFNFISCLLIVISIALYYDYLFNNGDLYFSLAPLVLCFIAFPVGWATRYILTGERASGLILPEWMRAKIKPLILIWIFWLAGVGLGQNTLECITNPLIGYSILEEKIELARKAGYSDDEIFQFGSKKAQIALIKVGILYPLSVILFYVAYSFLISKRNEETL
jgi:hypothetical protein